VITPDGHTLIVGETAKSQFTAFDIDVNTGLLSDQRVWASLPGVNPDGCSMDAAGCMWVASPTGHGINSEEAEVSKFIRFAQGGQVLEEILPLEGNNAIACCIGTPRYSSVQLRQTFLLILSPFRSTDLFGGAGTLRPGCRAHAFPARVEVHGGQPAGAGQGADSDGPGGGGGRAGPEQSPLLCRLLVNNASGSCH